MDREPMPLDTALAKVRELAARWPRYAGDTTVCPCCHTRARRLNEWFCDPCKQAECDGRGRCRVQDDLKGV